MVCTNFKNYVINRNENLSFYYDPSGFDKFPPSRTPKYRFNILETSGNYLMAPLGKVFAKAEKTKRTAAFVGWLAVGVFALLLALPGSAIKKLGESLNPNLPIKHQILQIRTDLAHKIRKENPEAGIDAASQTIKSTTEALGFDKEVRAFLSAHPSKAGLYQEIMKEAIEFQRNNFDVSAMLNSSPNFDKLIETQNKAIEFHKQIKPKYLELLSGSTELSKEYETMCERNILNAENMIKILESQRRMKNLMEDAGDKINDLFRQMRDR